MLSGNSAVLPPSTHGTVLAQTKSSHLDSRTRNAEQSLGGIIFYENKLVSLKLNVKDSKLTLQNTAAVYFLKNRHYNNFKFNCS